MRRRRIAEALRNYTVRKTARLLSYENAAMRATAAKDVCGSNKIDLITETRASRSTMVLTGFIDKSDLGGLTHVSEVDARLHLHR